MTGELRPLIVRDPAVFHGQAVVACTRIMASIVLDCLAAGMTEPEIVVEHPTLTSEGVRAAANYGAELAGDEYPAIVSSAPSKTSAP